MHTGVRFRSVVKRSSFSALVAGVCSFFVMGQDVPADRQSAVIKKPATEVTEPAQRPAKPISTKVTFVPDAAGIVIVETASGERLKIDTNKKTVESISDDPSTSTTASVTVPASKPADSETKDKKDKENFDFNRGFEPYDYRVVNVPTPKNVPKGTWNLVFTHRFTQPLRPLDTSAKALFGLDSLAIPGFGLEYGITDKLYASVYRSPLCQRGICRTIEVGAGYNFLSQDKTHPVAVSAYASIEGNDNFTEEYTYNLQLRLAARAGKRVYLFFSPAVHLNSNGQRRFDPRPQEYFPAATVAESFHLPTNGASFGFGAEVMITRSVAALFDFVPRAGFKLGQIQAIRTGLFGPVTGFTLINSHPSLGFGIQKNIGLHSFALTFSNTRATTTARYNSSDIFQGPSHFTIGFNLSRRF